jgi:hypothetical protein
MLENLREDGVKRPSEDTPAGPANGSPVNVEDLDGAGARLKARPIGWQRTPRCSLVVVLPEDHVVSPERLTARLPETDSQELVDVIVACAGQPTSLGALQRRVRDLQVLLAPAGTSREELRELAMKQSAGDIVTFLMGAPSRAADRESAQTS